MCAGASVSVNLKKMVSSIKNKRRKHSLPINSTNFKKVLGLGLRLELGIGLVLFSNDSRVLNLKHCVVCVFLYCASYSECVPK